MIKKLQALVAHLFDPKSAKFCSHSYIISMFVNVLNKNTVECELFILFLFIKNIVPTEIIYR